MQISMVSSREMLEKSESISKLLMKLLEPWSTISVSKLSKPLTVYLFVVNDSKIYASLYLDFCKGDKIGLKGWQPSTYFLCTLQEQYIILSIIKESYIIPESYIINSSQWFQVSSCFFGHAVRVNKLFIDFIREIIIFYSCFLKSALMI